MDSFKHHSTSLTALFDHYQLEVKTTESEIQGSYWGESEAGLVGDELIVRADTPLHSALHEACHYICMDDARRANLHTDAGGTDQEENAVCYLQILLADHLPNYGREQMMREMDEWGYSFRLGSAKAWFENDADDAREFLIAHSLINQDEEVILGALRH